MQVSLLILPDYNCSRSIYSIQTSTQVCAGIGNGKDTCQGDSGKKSNNLLFIGRVGNRLMVFLINH